MHYDKKDAKRRILAHFRALDPDSGYILPRRWVEDRCLRTMPPAARPVVEEAVCDLVTIGILSEVRKGMGRLALTDLGAELILRN
jgi:hypothetical protein